MILSEETYKKRVEFFWNIPLEGGIVIIKSN